MKLASEHTQLSPAMRRYYRCKDQRRCVQCGKQCDDGCVTCTACRAHAAELAKLPPKDFGPKRCPKCGVVKEPEAFKMRRGGRFLMSVCWECNANEFKQKGKTWTASKPRPANAERQRRTDLKIRFGITPEQYDVFLAAQGGKCAICGADRPDRYRKYLYIDHDHKTGHIRGLLCATCNSGVGQLKDSPALMRKAAEYLERDMLDRQLREQAAGVMHYDILTTQEAG